MSDFVDRSAVAKRLGISPKTITHLCARREIEFVRVGRLLKFKPAAVDAYIARQTTPAAERPAVAPATPVSTLLPLPPVRHPRFQ